MFELCKCYFIQCEGAQAGQPIPAPPPPRPTPTPALTTRRHEDKPKRQPRAVTYRKIIPEPGTNIYSGNTSLYNQICSGKSNLTVSYIYFQQHVPYIFKKNNNYIL